MCATPGKQHHSGRFMFFEYLWNFCWKSAVFKSRKVAPSYLSSPLAVQATFPFVWVAGDVPDLERLSKGFSLWGGSPPLPFTPGPRFFWPARHGVLKSGLQQCQSVLSAPKTARLLKFKCWRANPSAQPFLLHHLTSFHSRTQLRVAPQLASHVSSCS